jgi:hypothetical protein
MMYRQVRLSVANLPGRKLYRHQGICTFPRETEPVGAKGFQRTSLQLRMHGEAANSRIIIRC